MEATKYIINDGQIIIGTVEFHNQLLGKNKDKKKTRGGGRWNFDEGRKIVWFYGFSTEFGQVRQEDFEKAMSNSLLSPFWDDCKIYFSEKEYLSDAMKDYVEIKRERLRRNC